MVEQHVDPSPSSTKMLSISAKEHDQQHLPVQPKNSLPGGRSSYERILHKRPSASSTEIVNTFLAPIEEKVLEEQQWDHDDGDNLDLHAIVQNEQDKNKKFEPENTNRILFSTSKPASSKQQIGLDFLGETCEPGLLASTLTASSSSAGRSGTTSGAASSSSSKESAAGKEDAKQNFPTKEMERTVGIYSTGYAGGAVDQHVVHQNKNSRPPSATSCAAFEPGEGGTRASSSKSSQNFRTSEVDNKTEWSEDAEDQCNGDHLPERSSVSSPIAGQQSGVSAGGQSSGKIVFVDRSTNRGPSSEDLLQAEGHDVASRSGSRGQPPLLEQNVRPEDRPEAGMLKVTARNQNKTKAEAPPFAPPSRGPVCLPVCDTSSSSSSLYAGSPGAFEHNMVPTNNQIAAAWSPRSCLATPLLPPPPVADYQNMLKQQPANNGSASVQLQTRKIEYYCEECKKRYKVLAAGSGPAGVFGSKPGASSTSATSAASSNKTGAVKKSCLQNHFVRVRKNQPNIGDHVYTTRLKVDSLSNLFQFSTLSHFVYDKTWLPCLPERHGICIGPDKIATFTYDTESWYQESGLVSLQAISIDEFLGVKKQADNDHTSRARGKQEGNMAAGEKEEIGQLGASKSAASSSSTAVTPCAAASENKAASSASGLKQLYVSHIGGQTSSNYARMLLGKRGFSLPAWTCWHVSEFVKNRLTSSSLTLPMRYYGSFLLQDPVFPFGFAVPALKNALLDSDEPEEKEWKRCDCSATAAGGGLSRGAKTGGNDKNIKEDAERTSEKHSYSRKEAKFLAEINRGKGSKTTSSGAVTPSSTSPPGFSSSKQGRGVKLKFSCAQNHSFCNVCVERHFVIRGVPKNLLPWWRTENDRTSRNQDGKVNSSSTAGCTLRRIVCPHPLCYEVVQIA